LFSFSAFYPFIVLLRFSLPFYSIRPTILHSSFYHHSIYSQYILPTYFLPFYHHSDILECYHSSIPFTVPVLHSGDVGLHSIYKSFVFYSDLGIDYHSTLEPIDLHYYNSLTTDYDTEHTITFVGRIDVRFLHWAIPYCSTTGAVGFRASRFHRHYITPPIMRYIHYALPLLPDPFITDTSWGSTADCHYITITVLAMCCLHYSFVPTHCSTLYHTIRYHHGGTFVPFDITLPFYTFCAAYTVTAIPLHSVHTIHATVTTPHTTMTTLPNP